MLNLVKAFLARGREVDLVLCRIKGAYRDEIPDGARVIELEATGNLMTRWLALLASPRNLLALARPVLFASKISPEIARLRSLRNYLDARQPDVLLSALTYANLVAVWAKGTARRAVPVVVSERIALTSHCATPSNVRKWRWRYLPALVKRVYPDADAVVAVSNQVADDLVEVVGLDRKSVRALYNPVVDEALRNSAMVEPEHVWFLRNSVPVVMGVGRLTEQKDFATLMRAFARVRQSREARLVILGEGRQREELEALAESLGIRDDVWMPGFVENPFQYLSRASVFVLSSEYEGLPGVLIQALGCGCPVVSTNCPGGSAEILADGKYGRLVGVGDIDEMKDAILAELDQPTDKSLLLARAEDFSVDRSADRYLELLDAVGTRAGTGNSQG